MGIRHRRAGRLLGINPFDQPDVEAAKVAARGLLDAQPEPTPADFTDGAIEVRGGEWLGGAATAADAVNALLGGLGPDNYLSVQAYFDRLAYADLEGVRDELAAVSRTPCDLRLGPPLPALHRPIPQGRTRDRCLPSGHRPLPRSTLPSRSARSRSAS